MNDTHQCDRCNEVNDIADVKIVDRADGIGEVVCKPCLADESAHYQEK